MFYGYFKSVIKKCAVPFALVTLVSCGLDARHEDSRFLLAPMERELMGPGQNPVFLREDMDVMRNPLSSERLKRAAAWRLVDALIRPE